MGGTTLYVPSQGRRAWYLRDLCRVHASDVLVSARLHPLANGVRNGKIAMGVTTGVYLIREFSPELKKIFHGRF